MTTYLRLLFLLLPLLFAACRKEPLNYLSEEEQRIYMTSYDKAASFGSYRSFSIADRVVVVDNGGSRQQSTLADQALMQALANGLQSRGFRTAALSANPDLGVQITHIIRTTTGFVTGPDYWGFWDPGFWGAGAWNPGFGWGPGWTVMPYEVREGMLAIDLIDLKSNNRLRVLWNALVRGPGLFDANEAADIVSNLLQQSPYLKTN